MWLQLVCVLAYRLKTGKEQMTLVTRLNTRLRKEDRLQLRASLVPNNELVWATTDSPFMSTHVRICGLNGQPDVWMLSMLCIYSGRSSLWEICAPLAIKRQTSRYSEQHGAFLHPHLTSSFSPQPPHHTRSKECCQCKGARYHRTSSEDPCPCPEFILFKQYVQDLCYIMEMV